MHYKCKAGIRIQHAFPPVGQRVSKIRTWLHIPAYFAFAELSTLKKTQSIDSSAHLQTNTILPHPGYTSQAINNCWRQALSPALPIRLIIPASRLGLAGRMNQVGTGFSFGGFFFPCPTKKFEISIPFSLSQLGRILKPSHFSAKKRMQMPVKPFYQKISFC